VWRDSSTGEEKLRGVRRKSQALYKEDAPKPRGHEEDFGVEQDFVQETERQLV
jgi:hypothetical protein